MKKIKTIYFLTLFASSFLVLYPIFLPLLYISSLHYKAHQLRRFWAKFLFVGTKIKVEVICEEDLDPNHVYVFCPNHTSYLDIPVIAYSLKHFFRFMAKAELKKIPLFRTFFKTIDIPVDRHNKKEAFKAYQSGKSSLLSGTSLVIFPEGGIPRNIPNLGNFKKGSFKLAAELGIPVVPITIIDNWQILPSQFSGLPHFNPGRCRVIIHKRIFPDLNKSIEENSVILSRETKLVIENTLKAHEIIS